jgi:HK97 family phage portal protein
MSVVGRALASLRPMDLSADVGGSSGDWPWSGAPPDWWLRGSTAQGLAGAVGAPALLGVVLRLSGAASLCPIHVFQDVAEVREQARDSWQWDFLHDGGPIEDVVPSAVWSDAAASLAGCGNWYARKIEVGGRVVQLLSRNPQKVKPRVSNGQIVYDDSSDGRRETVTRREMFHARMVALPGEIEGISQIGAMRTVLTATLSRQAMQKHVMDNDARPGMVVKTKAQLNQTQAEEWEEKWLARHQGPGNAGRPTLVSEGTDIEIIPLNLADLQFVEQQKMTREEIGGVYGMTPPFLGDGSREITFEDRNMFATFALGPIQAAISGALNRDRDIFPRGERMFCEFLTDALLRSSTKERYEAYRVARQGGWISANEIRRAENKPPVEGGDEIQLTPVGGAPNPGRREGDG